MTGAVVSAGGLVGKLDVAQLSPLPLGTQLLSAEKTTLSSLPPAPRPKTVWGGGPAVNVISILAVELLSL